MPGSLGHTWKKVHHVYVDSPFCLFFKSIAWHHSKFTFALYLGLNFFLQVYFYPELCFVLLPAINLLLPYPYFIFPLKVAEVFFPPENFPCEALHVILSVSECSSPKFQKDMDVGLFFTHGIRIPVPQRPSSQRPHPSPRDAPQEANLRDSTQLSWRCSWYFSGFRTCRSSTLLLSMPTASQSWLGQWPREKI